MDAFSRSLAAAALVDGQHFTLPGFGTIEGVYISARIDHGARRVEAPRLEVRWDSEEDQNAQTFADLLVSTGATSYEAEDIEGNWLDALTTGEPISIGDLGTLVPDATNGTCSFEANPEALASTFSGSLSVPLEPISKRALPAAPIAPVVAINTKNSAFPQSYGTTSAAKPNSSSVRKLVPYASAAAIILLGVMAINFFSRSPDLDKNLGKAVTVNQDRLNRSPREEATMADLPIQRIEEDAPSNIIAGEPDAEFGIGETVADDLSEVNSGEVVPDVIHEVNHDATITDNASSDAAVIPDAPVTDYASPDASVIPDAPAFDPAGLAGVMDDDTMFAISEIDIVIVLGSFGNASNAARLTEKIAAAGLIPYVDQPGELTRVGATFSVSSEAEIEALKQRMSKEFNPNAWVLE